MKTKTCESKYIFIPQLSQDHKDTFSGKSEKGACIIRGEFSPSSFRSKSGNCPPTSHALRIKQRVFISPCAGELSRAGKARKELQSFIQGQLCLLVVELEIKVRAPPSFFLPCVHWTKLLSINRQPVMTDSHCTQCQ